MTSGSFMHIVLIHSLFPSLQSQLSLFKNFFIIIVLLLQQDVEVYMIIIINENKHNEPSLDLTLCCLLGVCNLCLLGDEKDKLDYLFLIKEVI